MDNETTNNPTQSMAELNASIEAMYAKQRPHIPKAPAKKKKTKIEIMAQAMAFAMIALTLGGLIYNSLRSFF